MGRRDKRGDDDRVESFRKVIGIIPSPIKAHPPRTNPRHPEPRALARESKDAKAVT
jgi:hypothetical protein